MQGGLVQGSAAGGSGSGGYGVTATGAPSGDAAGVMDASAGGSRPRVVIDLEAHTWTLTQDDLLLLAVLAGLFSGAILAVAEVFN